MKSFVCLLAALCVLAFVAPVQAQSTSRGALGVTLVPNDDNGAVVARVIPGTPAAAAKIQVGDRILSINEEPVSSYKDVTRLVRACVPGSSVYLRIERQGLEGTLRADLANEAQLGQALQVVKPEPPVEVIRAKRFEVVADDGTVLAVFGQVKGTGSLGLYDRHGNLQFIVSGTPHGGAMALTKGNVQLFRVNASEQGGVVEVFDANAARQQEEPEIRVSQEERFGNPSR